MALSCCQTLEEDSHEQVEASARFLCETLLVLAPFLVISFVPTSLVFQHERNQGQVLYIASSL
jgi:hypothetical protein